MGQKETKEEKEEDTKKEEKKGILKITGRKYYYKRLKQNLNHSHMNSVGLNATYAAIQVLVMEYVLRHGVKVCKLKECDCFLCAVDILQDQIRAEITKATE